MNMQQISKTEDAVLIPPKKKRESNIELYRMITMLLIIAHHYVVNSGLISDEAIYSAPLSWRSVFLLLFGAWGKAGINCFVLITGYFMCKQDITFRKYAKLVFEILFYKVLIYAVFLLTGYEAFSITALAKAIIPISSVEQNFTGCFLIFYLCIPFLNILVRNMSEKQHVLLLCLAGFAYVLFGTVHRVEMNYVSWFIVVYFAASYIRLYPKACFSDRKLWGWATLSILIMMGISVVVCTGLGVRMNMRLHYFFAADSNTILAAALGISSFLYFRNARIPCSKAINMIAASTFGVLLIHANSDAMRSWLWGSFLDNVGHYGSPYMPLHAVGSVLGVFAVCTVIDMLRIRFVEKPFLKLFDAGWKRFEIRYKEKRPQRGKRGTQN